MFVKLCYWNYSGDRGPHILSPRVAFDPRTACWSDQYQTILSWVFPVIFFHKGHISTLREYLPLRYSIVSIKSTLPAPSTTPVTRNSCSILRKHCVSLLSSRVRCELHNLLCYACTLKANTECLSERMVTHSTSQPNQPTPWQSQICRGAQSCSLKKFIPAM